VTIAQLELAIAEHAFAAGWVVPQPPATLSGRRVVAVIGSGPAGLAAAQQLRRAGHEVTVFEQAQLPGGLLRYGIPSFKLDKRVLDRRLGQIEAEGVRFETAVRVGEDVSAEKLRKSFDALLLALGSEEPRDLPVPGRELDGVHHALEFLTLAGRLVAGDLAEDGAISARDQHVLVIGGGDTGADCVGTANRMIARSVRQIEILPQPPELGERWNPSWPAYPSVKRTSSSHEEGCERDWAVQTRRLLGQSGRVCGAELVRVEWTSPSGGCPEPVELDGTEFRVDADLVVLALGFLHVRHRPLVEQLGVALDARSNIACTDCATSIPGVFAAGDASSGPALVATAISTGRKAAAAIDAYLSS
jgi:glutamate synthase (NADPH/NADH) small chain